MLRTPSEFPMPGSYALLDGAQVRIISHRLGAGGRHSALVSTSHIGGSITRTVPIDDLQRPGPERPIHARKRRQGRAIA